MAAVDLRKLPKPNRFGEFWLAKPGDAPAILTLGVKGGNYMLSTWQGVVFDGKKIRAFATAEEAFTELRRMAARGK